MATSTTIPPPINIAPTQNVVQSFPDLFSVAIAGIGALIAAILIYFVYYKFIRKPRYRYYAWIIYPDATMELIPLRRITDTRYVSGIPRRNVTVFKAPSVRTLKDIKNNREIIVAMGIDPVYIAKDPSVFERLGITTLILKSMLTEDGSTKLMQVTKGNWNDVIELLAFLRKERQILTGEIPIDQHTSLAISIDPSEMFKALTEELVFTNYKHAFMSLSDLIETEKLVTRIKGGDEYGWMKYIIILGVILMLVGIVSLVLHH
jgi:hypothetical protein